MSPTPLESLFQRKRTSGEKAFIPYLTVGDPDLRFTLAAVEALVSEGADAIELGLPFSDPVADGPANLASASRALGSGTTPLDVLEVARQIRARGIQVPLILFTYLNPVLKAGPSVFLNQAKLSGVDATLIVDLPPEEAAEHLLLHKKLGLDPIFLCSPTTPPERARIICAASKGFVYYVSRAGVTGVQASMSTTLDEELKRLKSITSLPICVGFGISTPEQARLAALNSDGVIVGSAFVRLLEKAKKEPKKVIEEIRVLARSMIRAIQETPQC